MAERKGNMANKDNAFIIMVNLYIIRYLYRHMEKASVFMDATGQRKKTIGFDIEVHLSRQRIINILHTYFLRVNKFSLWSSWKTVA